MRQTVVAADRVAKVDSAVLLTGGSGVGPFETADGGTIFLDEAGNIQLDLQVKPLRVLEDQKGSPEIS